MRKTILVAFMLLLIASSAYAYDTTSCKDANGFGAIGNCIIRGSFGADERFFAILMLAIFMGFMFQSRLPAGAAMGIGLVIFFALGGFLGELYTVLLNLAVLTIGIMVGLALLHFVKG